MAVASSGGHFKQLVALVPRIPDVSTVTWVTYDAGLSESLLRTAGRSHEPLVFVPYASPRDLVNLGRDARAIRRLLRDQPHDLVVSTGAGIAVAALPLARAMGLRSVFVESATRVAGPSLSGRILERVPGIELCSQHPGDGGEFSSKWRRVGSVHDEFRPGPDRPVDRLERVVVTVGTIRPYGFERLLRRLVAILPAGVEVLWQTGATDLADLPIEGRESIPPKELEQAIGDADVVVAHAGTGTALTAFELGRYPVLVPRRHAHGEHVDDHQVGTAAALAQRGLAVHAAPEDLTLEVLLAAARRTVGRVDDVPSLDL